MKFSENLKKFRKIFKLSQEKFAEEIGISRGQVANYETDASEPSLSTLLKISDFFKVPVDIILNQGCTVIKKTTGYFYIKSRGFIVTEEFDSLGLPEICIMKYRLGSFKNSRGEDFELLYLGSLREPIIKYLLDQSHSYEDFECFINIIEAQLGWKFIDKVDTKTYIIVDDPAVPGKYYHIYGNYMSGMKMGEIYQDDFIDGIEECLKIR